MGQNGRKIFSTSEWREIEGGLSLSARQADIVRCIFEGMPDKEIASKLGIAIPTVRTHLTRLFEKLNITDRTELMARVVMEFRSGCPENCPRKQLQQN